MEKEKKEDKSSGKKAEKVISENIEVTNFQAQLLYFGMTNTQTKEHIQSPLARLRSSHAEINPKIVYWSKRITDALGSIAKTTEETKQEILDGYKKERERPLHKKWEDEKEKNDALSEIQEIANKTITELMEVKNTLPYRRIKIDLNNFPPGVLSGDDMIS